MRSYSNTYLGTAIEYSEKVLLIPLSLHGIYPHLSAFNRVAGVELKHAVPCEIWPSSNLFLWNTCPTLPSMHTFLVRPSPIS